MASKKKQSYMRGNRTVRVTTVTPPMSPQAKARLALDAHKLVDDTIKQSRGFLYVDGLGRVRDTRHDADVAALPPRPPDSPARLAQLELDRFNSEPGPTVIEELRAIINKASALIRVLGG